MSLTIPKSSPLRFNNISTHINYSDVQPQMDYKLLKSQYQRGVYPINIYPDFDINDTLRLLYFSTIKIPTFRIWNLNNNTRDIKSLKIISATEWQGDPIYLIEYNFQKTGHYKISIYDGNYTYDTDEFYVKDRTEFLDLVKIRFSDSQNMVKGGYWYNSNGELLWDSVVYYTGSIKKAGTTFEQTLYDDEVSNQITRQSTPKLKSELTLTEIHSNYIDNISYQLSCENLLINGDSYSFDGDFNVDPIDNTELVNITATLSRNDNDNMIKLS